MSRTFSASDGSAPEIDRQAIVDFFEERASKIEKLGPVRAVIYQDKHANLAERRDSLEKERLTPLLQLEGSQRLLDIGCGTGRWTSQVASLCRAYHGIDVSEGLVTYARTHYASSSVRFSVGSADDFSLASLGEREPFDRILCAGVLMYLNDEEVASAFRCFEAACSTSAKILIREPMGIEQRLTIKDHYSEEMDQTYNAIYRTEKEIIHLANHSLFDRGFRTAGAEDLFQDADLNNRSETRQRLLVLERD
ncbi:class I SAM-dependent methyltransferase [Frateuria sp. MAH-13]|uniref:Class I SAM-dependent methyltransferase n=1 Tax=Frateuria flava TaxID=2821489 RepID=A0ABS4DNR8_9GAMM|nr:class I SAM-dependent methyltransferase [Frateuria flava]MBP1474677.1 class I SAM-dependent methyltransferase [Frateuria flava]